MNTTNKQLIFEHLEGSEAFNDILFKLELTWCDRCEDYTEDNVQDESKGCTGHPDSWEAPDIVGYCVDCGIEK